MEERQHLEPFSVDGEYVDGQWIEGEFYSRGQRRGKPQTREEALYGYESSDDGSDAGVSRRAKRAKIIGTKKSDLSKPLNFVTGSEIRDEEMPDVRDEEMPDVDEDRPGLGAHHRAAGLGFDSRAGFEASQDRGGLGRTSQDRGGLGFQGAGLESQDRGGLGSQSGLDRGGLGSHPQPMHRGGLGSRPGYHPGGSSGAGSGDPFSEQENDENLFPTAFGKQVHGKAKEKQKLKKSEVSAKPKGKFEEHTKGIGHKLLAKMGWKGEGLGKNEQGMTEPLQTKVRPKNLGMGFGDYKEAHVGPSQADDSVSSVKEQKPKVDQKLWLKKNRNKKQREYMTADELLARQQERGGESVQKVLDMRGPQVRVLTDMKDLNLEQDILEDDTPMPELQHNLRLIVNLVESDITNYDRKLRYEEQTVEYLRKEQDRLNKDLARQGQRVQVMTLIMSTVAQVQEGFSRGVLTLEAVVGTFKQLRVAHPEDYKICDVSVLALGFLLPLLASHFNGWEPLVQPDWGIQAVQICRQVFEQKMGYDEDAIFPEADVSPYTRLLNEAVMPYFTRSCIKWDVRDPTNPMVCLVEKWQGILTPWVLQTFLEQWILPKLSGEVQNWNPMKDRVAIHTWIHPWLPLLGSRMEPLYEPIRMKIEKALQKWQASDSSAHTILQPWRTVFDPTSWEQLLVRSILPKLMQVLDTRLVINPHEQVLDPFVWVARWFHDVPIPHMVALLEKVFFPKWQHALYTWLTSENPDFGQISGWFTGWKQEFTQELLANDRIRWQLNGALNMMDQAVEGKQVVHPGVLEDFVRKAPAPPPQRQAAAIFADDRQETLKEIVEIFAQENDVKFLPKPGRLYDGLQVYGFGGVSVAIDSLKEVVFALSGERWSKVTLEDLLNRHRTSSSGGSRWK